MSLSGRESVRDVAYDPELTVLKRFDVGLLLVTLTLLAGAVVQVAHRVHAAVVSDHDLANAVE